MSAPLRIAAEIGKPVLQIVSGVAGPGHFQIMRALPPGLSVNMARGTLEGVPTTPGVYLFAVTQPAGHPTLLVEVSVFPGTPIGASPWPAADIPPAMPVPSPVIPVVPPVLPATRPAPRPPAPPPHAALADFFDLAKPCPDPGCAELRVRYKESLDKLTGTGCSACALSALKQKYAHEYRRLLVRV